MILSEYGQEHKDQREAVAGTQGTARPRIDHPQAGGRAGCGASRTDEGELMAKNGNGEGSIYEHKKNGIKVGYRGAYWVYTSDGPKRRYVQGKTRAEVNQKLTKVMADRDGGLVFDAGSITVGEYLE